METELSPVILQLKEIQSSLTKTTQIAETAMKMGLALQEESHTHQAEITSLKDKLLTLAVEQRSNNLKFRELEETQEINSDIISFMSHWLASELALEPEILPLLTKHFGWGH